MLIPGFITPAQTFPLYLTLVHPSTYSTSPLDNPTGISNWTHPQWNTTVFTLLSCPCPPPLHGFPLSVNGVMIHPGNQAKTLGLMLDFFFHLLPTFTPSTIDLNSFTKESQICPHFSDSYCYQASTQIQGINLSCLSFCNIPWFQSFQA